MNKILGNALVVFIGLILFSGCALKQKDPLPKDAQIGVELEKNKMRILVRKDPFSGYSSCYLIDRKENRMLSDSIGQNVGFEVSCYIEKFLVMSSLLQRDGRRYVGVGTNAGGFSCNRALGIASDIDRRTSGYWMYGDSLRGRTYNPILLSIQTMDVPTLRKETATLIDALVVEQIVQIQDESVLRVRLGDERAAVAEFPKDDLVRFLDECM